jgi:hypothetical protein
LPEPPDLFAPEAASEDASPLYDFAAPLTGLRILCIKLEITYADAAVRRGKSRGCLLFAEREECLLLASDRGPGV